LAIVSDGIAGLASALAPTDDGLEAAAIALRTTDSRTKAATATLTLPEVDGLAVRSVRVTGIAKGVGMIHPRMATMLAVLLTDASVEPPLLYSLLRPAAARTWDQLSVDGDTSTNDTVFLLASGSAGAAMVAAGTHEAAELGRAIEAVARDLARQQAADGEGATTLITTQVSGAVDDADARAVARAVISSSLVQAAVRGWPTKRCSSRRASARRRPGAGPGPRRSSIRIGSRSRLRVIWSSTGPTAVRSPSIEGRSGRRWTRPSC
jgi:glutamate N-acetyltransferase/amino-acid N-acetyltransferase